MSDLLDTISDAVDGRCACGCGEKLDPEGPSAWFAGQDCQMRYLQARAIRAHEIVPPPLPPRLPALPVLSRIHSAEELAAARLRLQEAVAQMGALVPSIWDGLKPVFDAVTASLRRLATALAPVLHNLAPIVEAHEAHRRRLQAAYRRHLHTSYSRRVLARRRKARR